jgi:hypothetical protein
LSKSSKKKTIRKVPSVVTENIPFVEIKTISSNNIIPSKDIPSKEVPSKEVPSKEVPSKEVPSKEVPSKEVPSKEVPLTNNLNQQPKKKFRLDLVIFVILIYTLGIFTGIFASVGIAQGDVSLNSFQRFFSSQDSVIVEDINQDNLKDSPQGIVIDKSTTSQKNDDVVLGGGSESSGSGIGTVVQNPDTSVDDDGGSGLFEPDTENYPVPDNRTFAD